MDRKEIRDCYPIGKALAESLCLAYAREYGVPTSCLRLSQVLGYIEGHDAEKKFYRQVIAEGNQPPQYPKENFLNLSSEKLRTLGGSHPLD